MGPGARLVERVARRSALAIVRASSRLVPGRYRSRWVQEWEAELCYRSARPGLGATEAVRTLGRSLGALPHAIFLLREAFRWDALCEDLRQAARAHGHRPGLVVTAAITFAAGIGLTTALFSVVDAVLLQPLAYREPQRLVALFEIQDDARAVRHAPSPANVLDWRRESVSFDAVGSYWIESTTLLSDVDEAEVVPSARVTVDFFPALGVPPLFGRWFTPSEVASQERVMVLSYELWQRRYGGRKEILGKDVRLETGATRIVGILPPSFQVPGSRAGEVQLFTPWDFERDYAKLPAVPRDWRFGNTVARLAPGVSVERAADDLGSVARRLGERYPDTNHGWGVEVVLLADALSEDAAPALLVLSAAVSFLMILACANVSGLLLMRASTRSRELAVRTALGASRGRLVRQLLIESLLLSLVGGSVGTLAAWAGTNLLVRLRPGGIFRLEEAQVDGRALAFALAVSVVSGLVAGSIPALQTSRWTPSLTLKSGGRGMVSFDRRRQRVRSALVAVQIAAAVVLLVGSALLLRSFSRLVSVDPGFDPRNLLVVRMRLDAGKYAGKAHLYYKELLSTLRALPGVEAAGGVTALPMDELDVEFERPFWRDGEPRPAGGGPGVHVRMPMDGYFEAMRIPLLEGRLFDERDDMTRPRVVIVNEAMARSSWPAESAVGKRIRMDYEDYELPYEIVGVVGDTRFGGFRSDPAPEVYIPHAQNPYLPLNVVLRTSGDPSAVAAAVREAVLSIDRNQPIHSLQPMSELVGVQVGRERFTTLVMSSFAALALLLATVGLYGVVAQGVAARQGELGLRMALGADRRRILGLVLAGALRLALVGAAAGLLGGILAGKVLTVLLFRVTPTDPASLMGALAVSMATVLVASYLPARRAASLDPTETLHAE